MSRARPGLKLAVFLGSLLSALACQRENAKKTDKGFAAPSSSVLDNMQFSAARRVSLESASAAMKRRDVQRLKQLSVWVRHRADVPILEPDDLTALDLAIVCLEHVSAPTDALAKLDALKSGQLKSEARGVCLGPSAE
jgi:hypothetical protein